MAISITGEVKQHLGMLRGELRQIDNNFNTPNAFQMGEIYCMPAGTLDAMRERLITLQSLASEDPELVASIADTSEIFERVWTSCLKERNQPIKEEILIHQRYLKQVITTKKASRVTVQKALKRVDMLLNDRYLPEEFYKKLANLRANLLKVESKLPAAVEEKKEEEKPSLVILRALLNNIETGGPIEDLRKLDSALDPALRQKMHFFIYEAAKALPKPIPMNHGDFGKVAFRGEEGFNAPAALKLDVLNRLISELK